MTCPESLTIPFGLFALNRRLVVYLAPSNLSGICKKARNAPEPPRAASA
jgi:hypothetical protein